MILGALAISTAVASAREHVSRNLVLEDECARYGMDYQQALLAQSGIESGQPRGRPRWWDLLILALACAVFIVLARRAVLPPLTLNFGWAAALTGMLFVALAAGGWALWRRTRFC